MRQVEREMSRLEDTEEQELVDWAEANDWLALKVNILGNVGWPDRIFIGHGSVTTYIEMKRRGKKPTRMQFYRMKLLAERGHNVGWFDNAEAAINFLDATSISASRDKHDVVPSMRRSILRSWAGKN